MLNWLNMGLFVLPLLVLNGCVFAPVIDSVHKAGLTESSRMTILGTQIRNFHEALQWGDHNAALALVVEESQPAIREQLRSVKKGERLVETKVEGVIFSEDAYKADVEVTIRYYQTPFYVVRDRLEKQHWVFSLTGGWKLERRIVEAL